MSKPRNLTLIIPPIDHMPLLEDKIVLYPKERNYLLPKDEPMSSPMHESIITPKDRKFTPPKHQPIPPKVIPIPPLHDGPSLLPTPKITSLYGVVPPPSSYKEKRLMFPKFSKLKDLNLHILKIREEASYIQWT